MWVREFGEGTAVLAKMIDKGTSKAQINSADMLLNNIFDELKDARRKGEIDLETYLEKLTKVSYEKDLSRFAGRRKSLRFKYEKP